MTKKQTINLLPHIDKPFTEKVLYFMLHYFRYILVVTQMVVICVFFYRFIIDQQVIDQEELFKSKEAVLEFARPLVDEAKALDTKQDEIAKILNMQSALTQLLELIFSSVPTNLFLTDVTYDQKKVAIEGSTREVALIRQWYTHLLSSKLFSDITVNDVIRDQGGNYTFSFELTLK
ncbi:MAG: Fimbrial assembly protein (PilN) [Microgenomates bacterium OLB22]|nr:MAG: Fimbrial assembly protein (PilN) [Microgenomates bacterium OLB22]